MSQLAYLLLVGIAALVSLQLLILMDRRVPMHKRLRDLGLGGDGAFLLAVVLIMASTIGAFAGSLVKAAGTGATVGLVIGGVLWIGGVVWAHLRRRPGARRRQRD